MSIGPCPECKNSVALSAKSCPHCGNRNFIVQSDSFVEICPKCDGSGLHYSHKEKRLIENDCSQCTGHGYVYQVFTYDRRDSAERAHYRNLAKKYQGEEVAIFDAINDQVLNEIFVERGGQLKAATRKSAELHFWSDQTLEASKRSKWVWRDAWWDFQRRLRFVVGTWFVVGFAGCILRAGGSNNSQAANGAFFLAFVIEGLIAGLLVLFIVGSLFIARVVFAQIKKREVGANFQSKFKGGLND